MVKSALDSLNAELSNSPDPKLTNVPKIQKEYFKRKLKYIYDFLNSGSLPDKDQRNFGLAQAVADSWPFDARLGEEIAKAEKAFIEAR